MTTGSTSGTPRRAGSARPVPDGDATSAFGPMGDSIGTSATSRRPTSGPAWKFRAMRPLVTRWRASRTPA